jgi:GntR family transcriptional regulator
MLFRIDFKSGMPVYLQLADQVRYAVASGALRAGESLPSIRPLAEQLHLNRNTVAKAYSELENQGVIETIAGKGCFARDNFSPYTKQARHKLLVEKIDDAWVMAHQLQVNAETFLELTRERLAHFERESAKDQNKSPGERSS